LKELQVDLKLRFCADDFNNWEPEVKRALKERVEISKVDYTSFRAAMNLRADEPQEAIRLIAAHRIANKPLIVEGVENESYIEFLREHWLSNRYGQLYGQGYFIEPGRPWDAWTSDLRQFGLPGGHFLRRRRTGSLYLEP
jgi:EAL domain-containing protein (putative c-di-GMP-specific phosphodiesterase class I)